MKTFGEDKVKTFGLINLKLVIINRKALIAVFDVFLDGIDSCWFLFVQLIHCFFSIQFEVIVVVKFFVNFRCTSLYPMVFHFNV